MQPGTFQPVPTFRRPDGSVVDFFCCGHTFLADGRLLVAGGTGHYDKAIVGGTQTRDDGDFHGIRDTLIYDPAANRWTAAAPMTRGRWYPTVIRLADGTILAASGLDENGVGPDGGTLEINAAPDQQGWTALRPYDLPFYPHLFELRDGRLFFTGGCMDTAPFFSAQILDPRGGPTRLVPGLADDPPEAPKRNQSASVLLPPAQQQTVMLLGGGPVDDDGGPRGIATQRVGAVDLNAADPRYRSLAPLNHQRMHVNAVLLPDRTVIAVGGGVTREASLNAAVVDPQGGREVFEAEIYDPAADTWTITAPATIARLYHSVALLLPDGRILSAGGNPDKGSQTAWLPPDPNEEERLEIFSPPYLFRKSPRPEITAPSSATFGEDIEITTMAAIATASLIAPGLTTHSFNSTQCLVDLPFVTPRPNVLTATIPTDRRVLPPGWYMLFVVDTRGVPSVATWMRIS